MRHGIAWLALRADGAVLVETRPPSGLLGGMLGLPGDAWSERPAPPRPPFAADWRDLGEVRHTFTHFHLVLRLRGARVPADARAPLGAYRPAEGLAASASQRHAQGAAPRPERAGLSAKKGRAEKGRGRRFEG